MRFIFDLSLVFVFALAGSQDSAIDRRWKKILLDGNEHSSPLLYAEIINQSNETLIEELTTLQPITLQTTILSSENETPIRKQLFKKSVFDETTYEILNYNETTQPTNAMPIEDKTIYTTPSLKESLHTILISSIKEFEATHNDATYTTPSQKESTDSKPTYNKTSDIQLKITTETLPTHNETTTTIQKHDKTVYIDLKNNRKMLKIPIIGNHILKKSISNGKVYKLPIFYQKSSLVDHVPVYKAQTYNESTNQNKDTNYTIPLHAIPNSKKILNRRSIQNDLVYPIPTQNESVYTILSHNDTTYTVPKRNLTMFVIPRFMGQPSRRPVYNKTIFQKVIPSYLTTKLPYQINSSNSALAH